MLDTLERWGVRDFRTLALLPEHALASRLGEAGTRLQRLARGAGMRTLALCEPLTHFEEAMELESPVETLEPLSFVLNRLLEQLCARLEARALAVQELHLRLQLERRVADEETTTAQELSGASSHIVGDDNTVERTLRLPVAMRDTKVFLKLLQLELAAHPPGAPITKVWITAEPAPPRSAQRGLFPAGYSRGGEAGDYAGTHQWHRGRAAGGNRAPAGYPPARQLSAWIVLWPHGRTEAGK